jgi:hypothetical protein
VPLEFPASCEEKKKEKKKKKSYFCQTVANLLGGYLSSRGAPSVSAQHTKWKDACAVRFSLFFFFFFRRRD